MGRVVRDAVLPPVARPATPEKTARQYDHRIPWNTPVTA